MIVSCRFYIEKRLEQSAGRADMMDNRISYLHLYIGEGKGKTTSAIGMAVRAAGWNRSVLFCQFLKATQTGEMFSMKSLDRQITLFRPTMRHKAFLWQQSQQQRDESREDVEEGWKHIRELLKHKSYDMVVLDEMLDVIQMGLIHEGDILSMLETPAEWILTGRTASDALMVRADYITRMEPVRHPFQKGIQARKGIEY